MRAITTLPLGTAILIVLGAGIAEGDGCADHRHEVRHPAPAVPGREGPRPRGEVRAVWVARWDFITETDVRAVMRNCASVGLNRVYFQVRGQADAFYRSSLEPWGEELGGDPGFDPLEAALDEARRLGIELYAWVNVLPGWKGAAAPRDRRHLVHRHPEWFLQDQKGRRRVLDAENYTLLNPCLGEVREHVAAVCGDIAARYAIDGLQLDYIRFLDRDLRSGEDVPYDVATLSRFRKLSGGFPSRHPKEWDRFRGNAVNQLVEGIAAVARRARPGLRISVAGISDLAHARNHLFQDVCLWWQKRWVDEVCPMLYTGDRGAFERSLGHLVEKVPPAEVVPGIGLFKISGREAEEQIEILRRRGAAGYALFSYASLFVSRSPLSGAADAEKRARFRKVVEAWNRGGREEREGG